ncbi:mCG145271, partial [Mus musculus]
LLVLGFSSTIFRVRRGRNGRSLRPLTVDLWNNPSVCCTHLWFCGKCFISESCLFPTAMEDQPLGPLWWLSLASRAATVQVWWWRSDICRPGR